MKLNLIEFSSDQFTFNENCFTAEASDLQDKHLQRLYDDACDVGFAIKSSKTGNVVVYVLSETVRKDGEVRWWDYVPTSDSVRKHPTCANTTATVFND